MDGLRGKVALVTGAGSGIGRATAQRLARDGASVAVLDLRGDAAEATTAELRASGGAAAAIRCDVTQAAEVEDAVARVVSELGSLSLLVNAAGIFTAEGSVVDCAEAAWDRVLAVNLKAAYLTGKHALPEMRRTGGGAIVNIASVYGFRGLPGECAYDASKGAVINLTRQMAVDFAREGIRVNAVCPSDCDTPLLEALFEPGTDLAAEKRRLGEAIPMGRLAQPSDVAAAIAFLCSDDAAFITGVSLPVDGGYLAR